MSEENQVVTPAPVVEQVQQSQQVEVSPVEQQARNLGWKPKGEFEGNPDEWRSAKEFVERGEMIGKIRYQDRQLKSMEDAIKHITAQNQRVYANGYDQAIKDLKVQRREAIAEGDANLAEAIEQKIEETKEEKNRAIQAAAAPAARLNIDPEHIEWVQANPWYDIPSMAAWADTEARKFINDNKGRVSPTQVRDYVHKLVRQEFPEKFQGTKRTTAAPNPDGEGRGNRAGANNNSRFSKIEAGMSEDESRIMRTIMKTANMTKEEYLKQYSDAR